MICSMFGSAVELELGRRRASAIARSIDAVAEHGDLVRTAAARRAAPIGLLAPVRAKGTATGGVVTGFFLSSR
jgi:hypothetical protein